MVILIKSIIPPAKHPMNDMKSIRKAAQNYKLAPSLIGLNIGSMIAIK